MNQNVNTNSRQQQTQQSVRRNSITFKNKLTNAFNNRIRRNTNNDNNNVHLNVFNNNRTTSAATSVPTIDKSHFEKGGYIRLSTDVMYDDLATTNIACELLSERTIDALYAFLCLEEMFPMSTYLCNISIFQYVPIIACICNTMITYQTNEMIQKRGLNIIKCFAFNQIELSSIAMHSPLALLSCMKLYHTEVEYQIILCRILIIISSVDEFARENILRYNIHDYLVEILTNDISNKANNNKNSNNNSNSNQIEEAIYYTCLTITALSQSIRNVYMLTMGGGCPVYQSIIHVLSKYTESKKIQIEGYRSLITLSTYSEEILLQMESNDFDLQTIKKTKRFIFELLKYDKLFPEYTKEDIALLLGDHSINELNNEKCIIC